MNNLYYSELKIQEYLKLKIMTVEEAKLVFKFRTRQAEFSENFRGKNGPINCKLCDNHLMSFQCSIIKSKFNLKGKYEDIFEENISREVVKSLKFINSYREENKC